MLLSHLFPPKMRLKSINRIKITINRIKSLSLGLKNRIRHFFIQYFNRPSKKYQERLSPDIPSICLELNQSLGHRLRATDGVDVTLL